MIVGIALAMIHGFYINPDPKPLNATELQGKMLVQSQVVIPHMQKTFPLLVLFNIGVAFIILMFPLYWIWIASTVRTFFLRHRCPWKQRYIFSIAVGHNTFFKPYLSLKTISFPVFLTMYYPHTLGEILAYILAGTFSLLCIDEVRRYFSTCQSIQDIHPGDLILIIFHQVWYAFILSESCYPQPVLLNAP